MPSKAEQSSTADVGRNDGAGEPASTSGSEGSVVEQMRTHRSQPLQTYPPDDLVLDDLIAGLQSEYGVPPTPQEYRLVIRTPSAEADAADAIGEDAPEAEETPAHAGTQMSASSRRRRRRRSAPPRGPAPGETDGNKDQTAGDPETGSGPG